MGKKSFSRWLALWAVALVCAMCAPAMAFAGTNSVQGETTEQTVQADGQQAGAELGDQSNQQGQDAQQGQDGQTGHVEQTAQTAPEQNPAGSVQPESSQQGNSVTEQNSGNVDGALQAGGAAQDQAVTPQSGAVEQSTTTTTGTAKTAEATVSATLTAKAHVQSKGWQGTKTATTSGNTITVGTTGKGLRLEALRLRLTVNGTTGAIEARAHVQRKGWMSWTINPGTTGKGLRIEAIQIRLTGELAKMYDVVYRAHVQNVGWQPWTLNGGVAGTTGRSLRIEALKIRLVKKDTNRSLSAGTYFLTPAKKPNKALAITSTKSGVQAKSARYANNLLERFYVWKNSDKTISFQSVSSGLFLAGKNGKLVQLADSSANTHKWALSSWNGGYIITNVANGKMALSSSKGVVGSTNARWLFTSTTLIPNGTYTVANVAASKMLDVEGASLESGGNAWLYNKNGGGNQAFTFTHKGSNVYVVASAYSFKRLDVAGGSKADGANVRQWNSSNSNAQKWRASLSRKGGLQFTNVASGKVLSATSSKSGANVVSKSNTQVKTQIWRLAASSYKGNPGLVRAYDIIKNRSSNTNYMIAVDLSGHWLYIFRGSAGHWSIYKSWQVSNGKHSTPTVVGDFTTQSKGYSFGHGYTCYYYTQFYGDYLFHSIKYYEGTHSVMDGRLGRYISMGCVRMAIDNAKWIYDNIPYGTHVKTYN